MVRMKSFACLIILLFVFGCASLPRAARENARPIFYPAEPNEPRLQFLAGFSSSEDLGDTASAFRKFITGEEKAGRPIVKPYGVAVYDNKIYICDTVNNSIDILDLGNRKFEYFRPKSRSVLQNPINLCFDKDGNMFIADLGLGQVVIFDQNGNFLGAIGTAKEFKPTDVKIAGDKIYIADLKSHSVKVFRLKDRQYSFSIPKEGVREEAKLFSPTNMAIDTEGNLYVSDTGAFRVQKYGQDGEFLKAIGSHGDALGQFSRPKGIAADKEGRVYVIDAVFENAQIFDKEGNLLLFFGEPASEASLVLPAGIAIDYSLKDYFLGLSDPNFEVEYMVLVTSQYGNRKLSVFGFGHRRSPKAKDKILRALFDGVPVREEEKAVVNEQKQVEAEAKDLGSALPVQVTVQFTHQPFLENQCDACHDTRSSQRTVAKGKDLCFTCHDDFTKDKLILHYPVSEGDCISCHDPHKSGNKFILKEPVPGICFSCHDENDIKENPAHEGTDPCTHCHNPHAANEERLLK